MARNVGERETSHAGLKVDIIPKCVYIVVVILLKLPYGSGRARFLDRGMLTRRQQATAWGILLSAVLGLSGSGRANAMPQGSKSRIQAALQNIMTLDRPGQDGFATIWDGNKYVQCGRRQDRGLRCEAAGALMQPSLGHVLVA